MEKKSCLNCSFCAKGVCPTYKDLCEIAARNCRGYVAEVPVDYWRDAPEWAEWLAMDSDGKWFYFTDKPGLRINRGIWLRLYGEADVANGIPPYNDWKTSLQHRPEGAQNDL